MSLPASTVTQELPHVAFALRIHLVAMHQVLPELSQRLHYVQARMMLPLNLRLVLLAAGRDEHLTGTLHELLTGVCQQPQEELYNQTSWGLTDWPVAQRVLAVTGESMQC